MLKNRIARWLSIYFSEYKEVYGDMKAVSVRIVLKVVPIPENIIKLGAEGVNQIWRDAKLRSTGQKRVKPLVSATEHSVGSKDGAEENLLKDMDVYASRLEGLL